MRKTSIKKGILIACGVFAVVLTIVGIICISNIKHTGKEQQQKEDSETMSAIRDTSREVPLTDDQFMEGIDRLYPEDPNSSAVYTEQLKPVTDKLTEMEIDFNISRINYFGTTASLIETTADLNPADLLPALIESDITRFYIQQNDFDTSNLLKEYLFADEELTKLYDSNEPLGASVQNNKVDSMFADVCNEYGLSDSTLTFTGDVLYLKLNQVSDEDILNIFDYMYRWCLEEKLKTTIRIVKDDYVLANAPVHLADKNYDKYNPAPELAANFRVLFYRANNFLKGSLKNTSDLYIL